MEIAIVGSGISGLGAAWLLDKRHEISVFEAGTTVGGHSNTVNVELAGRTHAVDTGFIVYNEYNYPHLTRLFAALGVETIPSDMSFSVSLGQGRFEYFGSGPGLFAQPTNVFRPGFWRLVNELRRFYREAPSFAERCDLDQISLGELLAREGYSDAFARRHVVPMAAAIWSSNARDILAFPAETFVRFFDNHGLFTISRRPQWRCVLGGSRRYVEALSAPFRHRIERATPIVGLRRTPSGVVLRDKAGRERRFDEVVLATHADQALAILGDAASREERRVLGAFRYQRNEAVLHRDRALMPRRRRAWASWNYLGDDASGIADRAAVTYWMNRLQRLDAPEDVFVTLNPLRAPAPALVERSFTYDHPQFDRVALEAQGSLPFIQGLDRVWFCGSYFGYGFHEDGLQAGISVAAALGEPVPWADDVTPMSPAWQTAMPATRAMAAE